MSRDTWEASRPQPVRTVAALTALQFGLFAAQWAIPQDVRARLVPDSVAILRRGEFWRLFTGLFATPGPWNPYDLLTLAFLPWFAWHWGRRETFANCVFGYLLGGAGMLLIWSAAALVWSWKPALAQVAVVSVPAAACLLAGPRAPFALAPRIAVPAWIPVAGYFGAAFFAVRPQMVEFAAHLAGALLALCDQQWDWRLSAWRRRVGAWRERTRSPAGAVLPVESVDLAAPPPPPESDLPDPDFDARVDELLAKISAEGCQSLTEDELKLLMAASDRYRRRGS